MKISLKTTIINVITALALAVLLECYLALAMRHPRYIAGFLRPACRSFYKMSRNVIQLDECGRYDQRITYRLKSGECYFGNSEFHVLNRINTRGLRDDEQSLKRPEIIVLGDSHAMGWGVEQSESFPQLLEKRLSLNVLNAGISSYGTAREMLLLQELDTSNLKYLIIQYDPNDHRENHTYRKNNFRLATATQQQYDSVKQALGRRKKYFPFKYTYGICKALAKGTLQREHLPDVGHAALFLDILMHHGLNKRELKIIVLRLDQHDALNDQFLNEIDSLVSTEKYNTLNVTTVPVKDILTEEDYFILDDHLNAKGHQKIAGKLTECLN